MLHLEMMFGVGLVCFILMSHMRASGISDD